MNIAIAKTPSAWIPVALSLTALSLVAIQLGIHGLEPEQDEGTVAHLWQLLMVAQWPVIGFFAYQWLGRARSKALWVLAVQALAALAAALPVYILGW